MLSTTPIPTTARWYGREFGDYYFYDGGPESGWDTKIENYVDDDVKQKTIEKSKAIDYTLSIIGAVLNIIHFIILSRKDLRINVIFIIMIGICISDLLSFFANIAETRYGNSYARGFLGGFCGTSRQYWETWIEFVAKEIQLFGRLHSAVLALIMAMIRTLSVMFPMSRWIEKMTKPIFGILAVLVSAVICFVRYLLHFLSFEVENSTGIVNGCVNAWAKYDGLPAHLEGTTTVVLTGLYVVTTVALIMALRIVKKRRKNLKTDK
ncbi:hypothetical protein CAEBREN_30474 [Caenorhabditis brenneri]|uniref:G-protein coupled receptors family 1 profile domain-containing protein n=1 Tax=Caenorhabditis brenneri TaxID=135651 RepID=G0MD67_CAEBE|nr:hypothetical protein CAEBREN_30474 [Caenorhabditis brenneri]